LPQDSLPSFPGCEVYRTTHSPAGKNAALLIADYSKGQSAAQSARAAIVQTGFHIVTENRYPLNTPDYSAILMDTKYLGADIIVNCGPSVSAFAQQARELGVIR
jgi:ABC-type branched-subunit amino acid transport system substrate-binding protein